MSRLHVIPHAEDHWAVKEEDEMHVISEHETREEAERAARRLSRERGGREIVFHGPRGRIRATESPAEQGNATGAW